MRKFCRNQAGKLSLEAIGWMVLALLLVAVGGAVAFTIMNNKADDGKGLMAKPTLICPADSSSLDARQYVPGGIPFATITSGGAVGSSGYNIVPGTPYIDINNDGATAEFVCVRNVSGF
jgi:hypothetical protein